MFLTPGVLLEPRWKYDSGSFQGVETLVN